MRLRPLAAALAACSLALLVVPSACSAANDHDRPVRLGVGGATSSAGGAAVATKTKRKKRRATATTKKARRALGSKGSSKGRSSRASRSSKGKGKGRSHGGPRTIYETVEFVIFSRGGVDDELCGTRDEVAPGLEGAFLEYFEDESEECGTDRDVESLVLAVWEQAPACSGSPDSPDSPSRTGKGKGGSSSSKSKGSSSSSKSKGSKGSSSKGHRHLVLGPGDSQQYNSGGHDRRLQNIQRSRGRFNRQSTCSRCRRRLLDFDDAPAEENNNRRLSKGSSKGSSSKGSKGSSSSSSSCSVDPADYLMDAGYEDVYRVKITSIKEVDCSSHSKDCTSTKDSMGACCGICGCACTYPSESLCKEEKYCLGGARPFEEDFCEEFVPSGKSVQCKKESCDDGSSSSSSGGKGMSHSK